MKKSILVLLVALFTLSIGYGQFSLRPQIGINFPSLTKEIAQGKFKGNVGFQFGVDLQLGGVFYIQPGLNFQTTSFTLKDVGDMNVSKINIPVIVGLKLGEGKDSRAVGFRIFAGPNFAINVNERLDDSFNNLTVDNIKNSQISGMAGAGLDLSILFIDAMYNFGFGKFFDDSVGSDASKNMFLVNAGIRLGF